MLIDRKNWEIENQSLILPNNIKTVDLAEAARFLTLLQNVPKNKYPNILIISLINLLL